jgi:cytochrome c biogenesis protein CcmG/thiol:disulfide interchange protein DsbE
MTMLSAFHSCCLTVAVLAAPQDADDPQPANAQAEELPAEWRDQRRPELREFWDTLEGQPAPPLTGVTHWLQAPGRNWDDLRGKVVLLDMWATWCAPCVKGVPELKALHKKYSKDGLVILGVHSARGFEKMRDFVKANRLPYSFAADTKRQLSGRLGVKYIPSYFVIDRKGVLRVAGAERSKLADIAKALLEEGAPPADESGWPPIVRKELYAVNDLRGKNAPPFYVDSWLTGEPAREGKVVLIDFWATWCPPCRKAIPELNALQKTFSKDLVVIGVSDEDPTTVRAFMRKNTMTYAQAIDPRKTMYSMLGISVIPHVLLIDSNGVVRWQGFPFDSADPLTEDVVRRVIELDAAKN